MSRPATLLIREHFETARRHFWIGGAWHDPVDADRAAIAVPDPTGRGAVGSVPDGTAADVDAAVVAARTALDVWSESCVRERRALLVALAEAVRAREVDFAALISAEMGAPLDNALQTQTRLAAEVFASYGDLLAEFEGEERIGTSQVVSEPVGVVAAITPWNYPLYLVATKTAAALAAGCSVILKPSGDAPLSAFLLAEVFAAAAPKEVPRGVFNVLTGSGAGIGAALAGHPGVDAVSFTGSTEVGRVVAATAAATVKRVSLELGGKSARVILADERDGRTVTDLGEAVRLALADVFYNSGQTCTACSRVLIPDAVYDEAVELAAEEAGRWSLGDPALPGDHLGPIATARQYDKVLSLVDTAVDEGARLVVGGRAALSEIPDGLALGHWIAPTVFADVTNEMVVAREEIFGPVVCLIRYRNEEEALNIANDSIYGLAGAVWCASESRAERFARRMRTGTVAVNRGEFNVLAPTGGRKQSGVGRELGLHGLSEYVETKTIQW